MSLAVTCWNPKHRQQNPFHGYRIKLTERPVADRFRVTCDSCGKTYTYEPPDVLNIGD